MDQRIINLFDEYTHKPLKREEFLKRLAALTGSMGAALAMLPLLEVNYAHAETISDQDDRLFIEKATYPSAGKNMSAYTCRPKKNGKYPVVMVIHENRGLNPHIEDVTRRMALEGFLAIAPDGLSTVGGTPEDPDKARELIQQLNMDETIQHFKDGLMYASARKDSNSKMGCIGFCWGGAM